MSLNQRTSSISPKVLNTHQAQPDPLPNGVEIENTPSFNHSEILKSLSDDWQWSKNAIRYSSDLTDSFIRLPMPTNHLEHLRGGVHTLDELSSPNNNGIDNDNGILLQNPTINSPLRLTLRLDNIPPSLEPNTSTEEGKAI